MQEAVLASEQMGLQFKVVLVFKIHWQVAVASSTTVRVPTTEYVLTISMYVLRMYSVLAPVRVNCIWSLAPVASSIVDAIITWRCSCRNPTFRLGGLDSHELHHRQEISKEPRKWTPSLTAGAVLQNQLAACLSIRSQIPRITSDYGSACKSRFDRAGACQSFWNSRIKPPIPNRAASRVLPNHPRKEADADAIG